MESEFPSNSKTTNPLAAKSTEPEKKVEKIISGPVVRRKKSIFRKFVENFTGGSDTTSVLDYVVFEILTPAAKDIFVDAFTAGIERKIYGDVRSVGRRRYGAAVAGRTDYNRISTGSVLRSDPRGPVEPRLSSRARATHDFGEIVLASRLEADAVIDQLFELVSRYEVATVADLYDLVGVPPTFQDNKWGWSDLRGSCSERVREGYLLNLPRPIPID
jgi:hypothetical protein